LLFSTSVNTIISQVGIGTINPQSQLDIRSTDQASPENTDGILIPKIDDFPQSPPTAFQDGMMVFVTGNGTPSKGFYYWDNTLGAWQLATGAKTINELLDGSSDNDGSNNGSSIFLGMGAGANDNLTDNQNIGIGYRTLNSNVSGAFNVGIGYESLFNNTTDGNIGLGFQALFTNNNGGYNTGIGYTALFNNINGAQNIAIGRNSLFTNSSGNDNVALGFEALFANSTGGNNIAVGALALRENTIGFFNNAVGRHALQENTTGAGNTAMGHGSLRENVIGNDNTSYGGGAGSNVNGSNNVFIGYQAGRALANSTNSGNVVIGYQAGSGINYNNRLYIDNSNTATPLLYGEFDNNNFTVNGTQQVYDTNATYSTTAFYVRKIASGTDGGEGIGNYLTLTGGGTASVYGVSNRVEKESLSTNSGGVTGIYNYALNEYNGSLQSPIYGIYNNAIKTFGTAGGAYGSRNLVTNEAGDFAYAVYGETNGPLAIVQYAGYFNGDVYTSGSYLPSARKLKNNVQPLTTAIEKLNKLNVKQYNYRTDTYDFMHLPEGRQTGFIAEEIATLYPELIKRSIQPPSSKEGVEAGVEKEHDKVEFTAVNYTGLIPHLVKAIQEQQEKIEQLEQRISMLIHN